MYRLYILIGILSFFVSVEAKTIEYIVQSGDTLYDLSHKYHTSVKKLRTLNHMTNKDVLKASMTLKLVNNKRMIYKKHRKNRNIEKKKIVSKKIQTNKTFSQKKSNTSFSIFDFLFARNQTDLENTNIISLAKTKLGHRYVWGASGDKDTFDCSGFTTYIYRKNGIPLPRRAISQSKYGKFVSRDELKEGDLIFFDTSKRRRGYVNHVGIYLGNGKFIHASSAKKKVIITSLSKKFYSQRYKGARRPS